MCTLLIRYQDWIALIKWDGPVVFLLASGASFEKSVRLTQPIFNYSSRPEKGLQWLLHMEQCNDTFATGGIPPRRMTAYVLHSSTNIYPTSVLHVSRDVTRSRRLLWMKSPNPQQWCHISESRIVIFSVTAMLTAGLTITGPIIPNKNVTLMSSYSFSYMAAKY